MYLEASKMAASKFNKTMSGGGGVQTGTHMLLARLKQMLPDKINIRKNFANSTAGVWFGFRIICLVT
jgi:hypothetical protein